MADAKTPKAQPAKSPGRRGSAPPRSKAQAEFDRYKARLGAASRAAMPGGFGQPPAFSIGPGATPGWGSAAGPSAGPPWQVAGGYAGMVAPYGGMALPPPAAHSLTDRLRYTLRLGVDVMNATLAGGLRVLGGLQDVGAWAASSAHGSRGCGCGGHGSGGHGGCGCSDCCSSCDPCCDPCCGPGVSSCGCGCC